VDERQEKKLRAAAVQERRMAGLAVEAVRRAEAKLALFRETWEAEREAMERGLVEAVSEAERQAAEADGRAVAAERAVVEAGLEPGADPGQEVFVHLGPAAGESRV
jgi:hypothetical protein